MKKQLTTVLTVIGVLMTSCVTTVASADGVVADDKSDTVSLSAVADEGLEQTREGWIYYEDFSTRTAVPSYLDCTVKGFSRVEIEEGALRATVIYGGTNDHAFLTYAFEEALSGQVAVETRVKTDSLAFANLLFFFCETEDFYDTGSVVANLAAEGGQFKNNAGSGWSSCGISCATGEWHNVKMVLDIDEGVYQLTVDGYTKSSIAFRKKVTSDETAIKYLRFGSQSAWADVSYEYIGVRAATEDDFVEVSGSGKIDYTLSFDGTVQPQDVVYSATGGGKADFSAEGSVTLATPTSGTVSVSKTFDSPLEGVFAVESKISNGSSASGTFANVLFLENSAYSGTAANIVTVAVESGRLRYHVNGTWATVPYGSGVLYLIDKEWYVIKAVCDCDAKKVKLYISGDHYKNSASGEVHELGQDVYLGEYNFRNSNIGNPDKINLAIGVGKANTAFTVDFVKVYSV